ncbi:MAG: azurin [Gammaproteobacteria bacterium]|nr:azurin [Gammaproteobacteria bacterium]
MKSIFAVAVAVLSLGYFSPAAANPCELTITGNDQLQFNKSELVVPASCDEVTVTLEHVGKLPVDAMGHNWVLTQTSDFNSVAQAGMKAGKASDYVPQGDDRVIAATDLVGGGESTSVTFDVSALEAGGDYTFFCSFPGHYAAMNGKFIIKSE